MCICAQIVSLIPIMHLAASNCCFVLQLSYSTSSTSSVVFRLKEGGALRHAIQDLVTVNFARWGIETI